MKIRSIYENEVNVWKLGQCLKIRSIYENEVNVWNNRSMYENEVNAWKLGQCMKMSSMNEYEINAGKCHQCRIFWVIIALSDSVRHLNVCFPFLLQSGKHLFVKGI